jgi:hypothetical protein
MTSRTFLAAFAVVMLTSMAGCNRSPTDPTWEKEEPDNPDDDPTTKGVVVSWKLT